MSIPSLLIPLLAGIVLLFQNCSGSKTFSDAGSNGRSGLGGWPYEGKLYASEQICDGDGLPTAKIKFRYPNPSLLVKENCQILSTPVEIPPQEITADLTSPTIVLYRNRVFRLEPEEPNPISFLQKSESWSNSGSVTVVGNAMTAPTMSGNLIVCPILYYSSSMVSLNSVTDNLGNNYRRATAPVGDYVGTASGQYAGEVWYSENSVGGANHQVSVNFSAVPSGDQHISCYEYSNVASVNSLESAYANFPVAEAASGRCEFSLGQIDPQWTRSLVFVAKWGATTSISGATFQDRGGSTDSAADLLLSSTSPINLAVGCNEPVSGSAAVLVFKARN